MGDPLNVVTIGYEGYNASDALVSSGTAYTGRLDATNKWTVMGWTQQLYGLSYLRFTITKAARAFEVYLDSVVVDVEPASWLKYHSASGAVETVPGTGAWTRIFATSNSSTIETDFTPGLFTAHTIRTPGRYHMDAQVIVDGLAGAQTLRIRLAHYIAATATTRYYLGSTATATDPTAQLSMLSIGMQYLDQVWIEAATTGVAVNLDQTEPTMNKSWFHGVRVSD
jgi:hypothetical protein